MSKFEKTQWIESDFTKNYRDDASIYLPFRSQFIVVTKSIYSYLNNVKNTEAKILDLGCGDGLFIQEFLKSFSPLSVTLVDGSSEMLESAKKRLNNKANINFINSTFQELLKKKSLKGNFNFIFSSLAIHHLSFEEKRQLYKYVYKLLSKGGLYQPYQYTEHELSLWYQDN